LLGELTGINYSDSTPDVTITRDNKGLVTSVTDGVGGWTYGYDAKDRLEREIKTASGSGVLYSRDSIGRRTGYSYWDADVSHAQPGSWATWGGWGMMLPLGDSAA
jgi:YD repeat-containing protein